MIKAVKRIFNFKISIRFVVVIVISVLASLFWDTVHRLCKPIRLQSEALYSQV